MALSGKLTASQLGFQPLPSCFAHCCVNIPHLELVRIVGTSELVFNAGFLQADAECRQEEMLRDPRGARQSNANPSALHHGTFRGKWSAIHGATFQIARYVSPDIIAQPKTRRKYSTQPQNAQAGAVTVNRAPKGQGSQIEAAVTRTVESGDGPPQPTHRVGNRALWFRGRLTLVVIDITSVPTILTAPLNSA